MNASIPNTAAQDRALTRTSFSRRWGPMALLTLFAAAGLALALTQGALHWGKTRVAQDRLSIAPVTVAPLVREVNAEGKVIAGASFTLVSPATGTIAWQVQAGDTVAAGQLLGKLSSPELESRLAQERASAASAQADWQRTQADAASQRGAAQAALATAELELQSALLLEKRQRTAFEAGASSALQWEAARDQAARARIQLEQSTSALALKTDALKFDIEARRAAYLRANAQADDLSRQQALLSIRAPQASAIGQRLVGDGAAVTRDAALLTVVDLRRLDVQLQVPESLVRELAIGQAGEVKVNGQAVAVRLVSISPEVVAGEVAARLRFTGAQPAELRQNQRLAARILLEKRDAVLGVQRGAFVEQLGGRFAWVLGSDGIAHKRAVALGAASLDRVEIKSGLQAGEQVVVGGMESLPAEINQVLVTR